MVRSSGVQILRVNTVGELKKEIGLNNSLLNIMSTTQTYKNDIEDQITS